jgi:Protein of unknown function with PCYCGC motif
MMGRKSTAKLQSRSASDAPPPEGPQKSSTALLTVAAIVVAGAIGAVAYVRSAQPAADTASALEASAALQTPAAVPAAAKFGPHKQANLPPLPFQAYAPPRPPEVVRAAYLFAAEHPEVLSYVPCFCGCERSGHKGNDDCFVAKRNEAGDVTEWEPHGLECTVCLDVANDARQMYTSGASVRDIRAAIEKKWAAQSAQSHTHTPTPQPPPPAK